MPELGGIRSLWRMTRAVIDEMYTMYMPCHRSETQKEHLEVQGLNKLNKPADSLADAFTFTGCAKPLLHWLQC